jgi:hypothetical protein
VTSRRFPPPWTVGQTEACFIVKDKNGWSPARIYFEDEPRRRARLLKGPICGRVLLPFAYPRMRHILSVATGSRTKVPPSITAMAIVIAATAVVASKPVTNFSIFLLPTIITGLPSTRTTVARHLPGFPSNGWMRNCLYSTGNNRGFVCAVVT